MTAQSAEAQIEALLRRERRQIGFSTVLAYGFLAVLVATVAALALVTTGTLRSLDEMRREMRQLRLDMAVQLGDAREEAARRNLERAADYRDLREAVRPALARLNGVDEAGAVEAARLLLTGERTRIGLKEAVAFESVLEASPESPAAPLFRAAQALSAFEEARFTELNSATSAAFEDLPSRAPALRQALEALEALQAAADPSLAATAHAGRALAYFWAAEQLNFRPEACAAMEQALGGLPSAEMMTLRLRLAQAECRRKLGRTAAANAAFAEAVELAGAAPPQLAYQAFHGRGTTAIALVRDDAPEVNRRAALDAAVADLNEAARLREEAGQIPSQINGSLENLGFALLRAGRFQEALAHTAAIDEVQPLAWNTTVRLLAARQLREAGAAREALAQLRLFRRAQFAECEMAKLLGPALAQELPALLVQVREPQAPAPCPEPA